VKLVAVLQNLYDSGAGVKERESIESHERPTFSVTYRSAGTIAQRAVKSSALF